MTASRLRSLLSRSLLSVAIVTCLLGLPQASAAAFAGTVEVSVAPAHDSPGHAAAQGDRVAPVASTPDAHPGHDEAAGVHAVGCMVAVGILAFAVLLTLAVLQAGGLGAASRRLRARVRAGLQPRPPSLAFLGILRV